MKSDAPGRISRVNPLALRHLLHALMSGHAYTYAQLAERCGLHHRTVRVWLVPFRKATTGMPRTVHIASWEDDQRGYATVPAFAWGHQPDAPRRPMSNAVRQRRYRAARSALRKQQAITAALTAKNP